MSTAQLTTGEEPETRRSSAPRPREALRDAVLVLGCYLILGLACGVLWWLVFDPAMFTKVGDRGSMGEVELSKRFNSDGWYAVIGTLTGLVSKVVITAWRSRDFLLTTCMIVVGSAVAAALMALTGYALGPGDTDAALSAAAAGEQVPIQLTVTAKAAYLVWPAATLIGALVVLWSPPKEPRDEPPE